MERILIVEDEQSILMALEDDLRMEGYEVETASDGRVGLSLALEGSYDLVILDLMLPAMDGFEVCRRLRQSGIGTPIVPGHSAKPAIVPEPMIPSFPSACTTKQSPMATRPTNRATSRKSGFVP